jgi:predicted AlkP superfamily phosphohydrolase/phosphomutase
MALHTPTHDQQLRPENRPRVLLVALDAADASLLLEGIERGSLPNLAKMKHDGAWGRFSSPSGFGSGAGWVTIATGLTPARHGRYFYRRLIPGSYEAQQFDGDALDVPTFAHAASDSGKCVAVFDFPCIPTISGVNGVSVADWLSHDLVYAEMRTEPPELKASIVEQFGANELRKCDRRGGRSVEEHAILYRQLVDRIAQRVEGNLHFMRSLDWDLFVTTFSEPHCVGHQCWHLRDPLHPLHPSGEHGDPVVGVYEHIDAGIGDLLREVDDHTTVIVATATGMGPNYSGNHILDDILRARDGQSPTATWAAVSRAKQLGKKVLPPSWRSKRPRLSRRVQESARAGDRARRPSFVVPHNDLAGAIRLNVVGREASGILNRGEEVDRYVEGLVRDLKDLRNLDTGTPVVRDVVRVADEIDGDRLDELPDLFVLWERETFPDRVGSDAVGEVRLVHRGNRTGDHTTENAFFAIGPGVEQGELPDVCAEDFAPTISALLGVDFRPGRGRVVGELGGGKTHHEPEGVPAKPRGTS